MKSPSIRKLLPWLAVAVVVALVVYRSKFRPTPVVAHTVTTGEIRGEVMGTGTLETRVKTTIGPRGRQVMELFAKVAHEQQAAVVVVTHDARALDIFDRIVEMEDGRLKNGTKQPHKGN